MTTQVPEVIEPLLQEYSQFIEAALPGFVTALYLQGSIALGAFNERLSDIDFVAFTSREWHQPDLDKLTALHQALQAKYPRWPFEGIYLQLKSLSPDERATATYLNQHDGKLFSVTSIELNHVDWWLLKQHGIVIKGTPAAELPFEVDVPVILSGMKHNLNTYWAAYTYKPARLAQLFTNRGVQWVVLGVLRQYYSFKEYDITSKAGAGEYALPQLPPKWHRLIQEALNLRQSPDSIKGLYKTKIGRAIETFRFLRYIIPLCNNLD